MIVPSATMVLRNRDVHYPFRQHSDYWYLTGFNEPDAIAVLRKSQGDSHFILFCQPKNLEAEQWTGPRCGEAQACAIYGADEAFPIHAFEQEIGKLLQGVNSLYTLSVPQLTVGSYQSSVLSGALAQCKLEPKALEAVLHEMRLIKDEYEIASMREAAKISVQAHQRAMQLAKPGINACEVQAAMQQVMLSAGCRHQSYEPIVAAGGHACVLHYTDNNAELRDGDLLLIDAGAESDYYAADITRTFPVNGNFTEAQRAVYDVVLKAQYQVIEAVRPGVTWDDLQQISVKVITQGLLELDILEGDVGTLIETQAYKRFYMHGIGHWLGLDVHDVGSPKAFEPNMVLTVEPGIYIARGSEGVDEMWQGIGIRIEDDILVTEQGHEVLTQALVKDPEDLSAFVC